jgi:hypothetical protein
MAGPLEQHRSSAFVTDKAMMRRLPGRGELATPQQSARRDHEERFGLVQRLWS